MDLLLARPFGDPAPAPAELRDAIRRQDWLTFGHQTSSESVADLVSRGGTLRVVAGPSDVVRTNVFPALEKPHLFPVLQLDSSHGARFTWLAPRVVTLAQELGLAIEAPVFISGSRWWKPPASPDERALGRAIEISRSFWDDEAWALLGFALAGAGCLELAESNPMLAALVATAEKLGEHRRSQLPVAAVAATFRELARLPRHHILGSLGFPRSRSTVRMLARVAASPAELSALWRLARGPVPPAAVSAFRHMPRLTSTAIRLATAPVLWPHVGTQLLQEAAAGPDDLMIPIDLEDVLRMARGLGSRHAVGVVQSRAHLRGLERDLMDLLLHGPVPVDTLARLADHLVDPPAGTATIQPLTTAEALRDEGLELQHCVGSYDGRVSRGEVAVYRVLEPERATLCLRWLPTRRSWHVEQLRGFKNQAVGPHTEAAVRAWLDRQEGA